MEAKGIGIAKYPALAVALLLDMGIHAVRIKMTGAVSKQQAVEKVV
jgi:hypothetical protein